MSDKTSLTSSRGDNTLINIIYVRGTVDLLLPLLKSFLEGDPYQFRLVSNGCSKIEENTIKSFVAKQSECVFYSMQSNTVLDHPTVLNHLLQIEESPYFIFMDSDIVLKKPSLNSWLLQLEKYDAIFTGIPVWHSLENSKMPPEFNIVEGRYLYNHSSQFIGLSYCAAYHTQKLKSYIESSGIGFDSYFFRQLSKEYQERLKLVDFEKYHYDTGKVLNTFYQMDGANMAYIEVPEILHIGGVSTLVYDNSGLLKRLYNALRDVIPMSIKTLFRLLKTDSQVGFKEAKEMEYLEMRKKAARALLLDRLHQKNIGFHNRRHIRLLNSEAVSKVYEIADVIESVNTENLNSKPIQL